MRFMVMVKATGYTEAGIPPSQAFTDAIVRYKQSLAEAGVLLAAEALLPSASGVRITYPSSEERPSMEVGLFPVDGTLLAEYILIDARTEDEALQWAHRMPVPGDRGGYEIELRRLEDHTDDFQAPLLQAFLADLRHQLFKKTFITPR